MLHMNNAFPPSTGLNHHSPTSQPSKQHSFKNLAILFAYKGR